MTRKTHAQLIDGAERRLQDSGNALFDATTELAPVLQDALRELSELVVSNPKLCFVVRETLTTTADSKELDISSIDNLLEIKELEYKVSQTPRQFRNWVEHYNNTISMLIDNWPVASESVYLYCAKYHRVPALTTLAGAATAGYAAGVATINVDGLVPATGTLEADTLFTITSDSTGTIYRLTADTVLATGAGDITFTPVLAEAILNNDVVTFENSTLTPQLETWVEKLTAAKAAMSKGAYFLLQLKTATTRLDTVNTTIGDVEERITQAILDLGIGRGQIDDEREVAKELIEDVGVRITQALSDLSSARDSIGSFSSIGSPQTEYAAIANREIGVASESMRQANSYLSLSSTSARYAEYAARELSTATAFLNKASGHMNEIGNRLRVSQAWKSYQEWGEREYASVLMEVRRRTPPRTNERLPTD